MKFNQENIIVIAVYLVIFLYFKFVSSFHINSILGKFIIISSIIALTLKNKNYGIYAAILYIIFNNDGIEKLTNNDTKTDTNNDKNKDTKTDTNTDTNKDTTSNNDNSKCSPCETSKVSDNEINDAIASFKKKHCLNGKLIDKNKNPIEIKDLASNFPEISFNLERSPTCNPCSESCSFKLTSGSERITVEEKLRPIDSSTISTS
jgi:hypothetical protein